MPTNRRSPTPRAADATVPFAFDDDAAIFSVGQVAEMLGVQSAFVRRLDAEHVVQPARSIGGQRRYTRLEVERVERVATMADSGHNLTGIRRILELEAELATLKRQIARLQSRPAEGS
jgi:MerR family transcriptional regulator, heat shock protein HspR